MKSSLSLLCAVAATLAWPLGAYAQSDHPLTREEVVQDLIQVEQAGYRPGWGDNTNYPANILEAEARVAARQAAARGGAGAPAGGAAQGGTGAAPTAPDHP
ncbi:DUF4148 domain-containing protein [Paraburkholderia humisilvae]|uniref:DUF4148 domain-containing protein n=1 Tax=Paraburkholderia humisilvae TaxID=627669 RepID=A0A6J5D9L4_9BURK|nr:DUF4148 domain-containing protein [Paraburkholderia humisilvae]CAB3751009.1 hypothetical protein LMG29542_01390 [Paraburkholderia humisilvae]